MPRKKVIAMFPGGRVYKDSEGRNPTTGEVVRVREAVALPLGTVVSEVAVFATVTFDEHDHVDSITLKSPYPRPEGATDQLLLVAANKVMAALGAEPLTALPKKPATWKHKSTQIELTCDDDGFSFELSPVS